MKTRNLVLIASGALLLLSLASAAGAQTSGLSLGIYIFENLEGYHSVSSAAGTELSNLLQADWPKVMVFDKVPLESNETVRILEEMTEDRKVVVTAINTWLQGGVISTPTVTFADDAIKFKDLTWHLDQAAVQADAAERGLSHVLIGTFTGLVKEAGTGGGKLVSVQVLANVRVMKTADGSVAWSGTYRDRAAGFDPRSAFDETVLKIAGKIGEEARKSSW